MKKRFQIKLLTGLILLFLCSCVKKAEDITGNSSYYIKFKSDGVAIEHKYLPTEVVNGAASGGNFGTIIGGQKSVSESNKNFISLNVSDADKVVVNVTYTNYQTTASAHSRTDLCLITMYDNTGKFFASWGDEFASQGVISDTKIKFTEITSTYVKGTFSGTVYKDISGTSEKRLITEGEFYAPL